MQQDLDALADKVKELARLAQSLRGENQQLRLQLTAALAELETMRQRVDAASMRLDALLERLPAATSSQATWKT